VVHCLLSLLQVGADGRSLQASSTSTSDSSPSIIQETPQVLTALTLLRKTPKTYGLIPHTNNPQTLRIVPGALATSLRSLSICGIAASVQAADKDSSSNAACLPVVGASSSISTRQECMQMAGKEASVGVSAGHSKTAGSSSSCMQGGQPAAAAAAAESAGGVLSAALPLPLLERAELKVELMEHAADMIRWVWGFEIGCGPWCKLQHCCEVLSLELRRTLCSFQVGASQMPKLLKRLM
jgi:hypothetical protein